MQYTCTIYLYQYQYCNVSSCTVVLNLVRSGGLQRRPHVLNLVPVELYRYTGTKIQQQYGRNKQYVLNLVWLQRVDLINLLKLVLLVHVVRTCKAVLVLNLLLQVKSFFKKKKVGADCRFYNSTQPLRNRCSPRMGQRCEHGNF